MRPDVSGDLDDSGAEEFSIQPFDEENSDLIDAGLSPQNMTEHREAAQSKVDANFFNKFDDDFDESDMKPSA